MDLVFWGDVLVPSSSSRKRQRDNDDTDADNRLLCRIVNGEGTAVYYRVRTTTELGRVFNEYQARMEVPEARFFVNRVEVDPKATPESVGLSHGEAIVCLRDGDRIDDLLSVVIEHESVGTEDVLTIFRNKAMGKVLDVYTKSLETNDLDVTFYYHKGDDVIDDDDTPETLGLQNGDHLHCMVLIDVRDPEQESFVQFEVRTNRGTHTAFQASMDASLDRVFNAHAVYTNKDDLRYFFRGVRIPNDATPRSLGITDNSFHLDCNQKDVVPAIIKLNYQLSLLLDQNDTKPLTQLEGETPFFQPPVAPDSMTSTEQVLHLGIRNPDAGYLFFIIQKTVNFSVIFHCYAAAYNANPDSLLFEFNGVRVLPDQTPSDLHLQDDDHLDCFSRGEDDHDNDDGILQEASLAGAAILSPLE